MYTLHVIWFHKDEDVLLGKTDGEVCVVKRGDLVATFYSAENPYEPFVRCCQFKDAVYGMALTGTKDIEYTAGYIRVAQFPFRIVTDRIDAASPPKSGKFLYFSSDMLYSGKPNGLCRGICVQVKDGLYTLNLVHGYVVGSATGFWDKTKRFLRRRR